MKKRIIQIVGIAGGVGDYAERLAATWRAGGYESTVISVYDGRTVAHDAFQQIADAAADGTEVNGLIIHFSGYGYASRGLCFWLVREVTALRGRLRGRIPIVMIYHELFAGGRYWSSAFWLQPLQRWIARQLARNVDLIWTNTDLHRDWLQSQVAPGVQVYKYPVFSNVGEVESRGLAFAERAETAIVFGSEGTRRRFFQMAGKLLSALPCLQQLSVLEIGPGSALSSNFGFSGKFLGKLPADELHELMSTARYGLLEYPGRYLAKSSVMAAYAAHGMLVCNASDDLSAADGLRNGGHYVSIASFDPKYVADHAAIAFNLERWYEGHRLSFQAAELHRLMRQSIPVRALEIAQFR